MALRGAANTAEKTETLLGLNWQNKHEDEALPSSGIIVQCPNLTTNQKESQLQPELRVSDSAGGYHRVIPMIMGEKTPGVVEVIR